MSPESQCKGWPYLRKSCTSSRRGAAITFPTLVGRENNKSPGQATSSTESRWGPTRKGLEDITSSLSDGQRKETAKLTLNRSFRQSKELNHRVTTAVAPPVFNGGQEGVLECPEWNRR